MWKEFKEFISRGNVIDLAVGVIIGGAFTSIVNSLVANIFTPILGIIVGGLDFTHLVLKFGNAEIQYGMFIQSVINFLLISFALFLMIKAINIFRRKKDKETLDKIKEEGPKEEVKLLMEIRDALVKIENKETEVKNNKPE